MALNNSQYDKIMRDYHRKQLKNQRDLEDRKKEIYQRIPEFVILDEQISTNALHYAKKLLLQSDSSAVSTAREVNLDLSMKKIELLYAHGYPKDYLTPTFHCKDCGDTGYINTKKCHCFKQAIVDLVYAQSNIKERLLQENFDAFSFNYYGDALDPEYGVSPLANIKDVVKHCMQFIHSFHNQYANLLIYGSPGVGKTFLTNCIAKELLDMTHTVIYLTAFQLFDILEKRKFGGADEEDEEEAEDMFDYILNCDLLIIDDLGTELNNSFISSQLFLCINERHLREKSTIISTNLSLADLSEAYSERFFSRISGNYDFLHLFGEDIRIKKVIES